MLQLNILPEFSPILRKILGYGIFQRQGALLGKLQEGGCRKLLRNRRDVEDIDKTYLEGLTFHYINQICDAIPIVLQ